MYLDDILRPFVTITNSSITTKRGILFIHRLEHALVLGNDRDSISTVIQHAIDRSRTSQRAPTDRRRGLR